MGKQLWQIRQRLDKSTGLLTGNLKENGENEVSMGIGSCEVEL